ncbi:MAG TPA: amidase family protein, partial [Caldilineaceae bacterium]|nr:amidase family protein [Caldilineaceae bacterium]
SSGGSGVFTYVAAQLNQDGQPVDTSAVLVGDRTQIQSMAIADGQIVLDIVTQGPDDPQCCPSLKVRKTYAVQDGQLVEVSSEELGAISVDDLNGTTWTLVELGGEEPAPSEEPISISFQDGQISGFGGCNRYNSTLTPAEENPLAVSVGPIAGTRMACPEPLMTQETTYFSALEHVSQWGYHLGQLSLFYVNDDGSTGTLLFAAQTMTEAASTTVEPTTASERITLAIELTTNPWLWVSFSDPVAQFDIEMPENYTVAFNSDGTVNIKADCNNASGSYTADDDGSLSIEIGPMTLAACPPESRSEEFVQNLGFVTGFFFEDGFLYLDTMADGGTFQLASALEAMPAADTGTASVLDTLLAQAAAFAPECPERSYPLPDPEQSVKRPLDFSPFAEALASFTAEQSAAVDSAIRGKTVLEIQELLGSGELTSAELVLYYVDRIRRYDENLLNAIMELNPDALTEAQARDDARGGADPGPLYGIPVTLKDNIATVGPMHTTAGNYALKDWQATRDAFLVQQLRDAGAIILGKNNLSEWANYSDPCTPNGFSSLGGQTRNPFGPYDTLGSSSGSAVAVSADLTTVSVGSETAGSLVQPARANGVVGMRPSKGLVSGDNIIPLEPTLDTAGPMGRSVTDVAVLLTTLAATDPDELRGADAAALADVDFTDYLSVEEARTIRVGVVRFDTFATAFVPTFPDATPEEQEQILDFIAQIPGTASFNGATTPVIEALESQGIEVVRINQSELPQEAANAYTAFISYGFADALNRFLGELDPPAPAASIEEVVEIINEDAAARAPYGQRYVENAASTDITADQYAEAVAEAQARAEAWLTAVYEQYGIDVLMVGTFYNTGGSAGVPAINIPIGRKANPETGELDEPAGVYITGPYLSDAQLIAVGYALEQALGDRVEPDLDATVEQIEAVTGP